MRELVRDKSPAELDALIDEYLQSIGVPEADRERFLNHAAFNPQEKVFVAGELVAMKGVRDRAVFYSSASRVATDEPLALFIRVRAQMMARYVGEQEVIRTPPISPFSRDVDCRVRPYSLSIAWT